MPNSFAQTAALFSDPGRASILTSLLGGVALPAGQLALIANVAPQTASSHLSQLVAGRLLSVEQQGRHRYYRLASAEVANAIEALLAIAPRHRNDSMPNPSGARVPGALAYARTCYSHLAGQVAVQIADALEKRELLVRGEPNVYALTNRGRQWLAELGIRTSDSHIRNSRFARPCLDWSERRHHIAGQLGAAMLDRFHQLKWIAPVRESRAVRVTLEGRRRLRQILGIES
ncbi:MAG: ArsR/SmtB family transcription factor [Terriglobales bacterium]